MYTTANDLDEDSLVLFFFIIIRPHGFLSRSLCIERRLWVFVSIYRLKDESRTPNENEKRRHIPPTKKKKKKKKTKKTERTPRARRGKAHSFYCKVVGVVVFY